MEFLVNIDVDDLGKGIAFYCAAFGVAVGRRFGSGAVELVGGPAPIYLLVKTEGSSASKLTSQTRSYARHWCPIHLDFVVPDIEAAAARAVAAGARLEKEISCSDWGRLALLADPFGHGFCFVQFHGKGYDEIAQQRAPGK